jgi:hypothetical protein
MQYEIQCGILKPATQTSLLQVKYTGTHYSTADKLLLSSSIGAGYLQNQKLSHQTGIRVSQKKSVLFLATQSSTKSLQTVHIASS